MLVSIKDEVDPKNSLPFAKEVEEILHAYGTSLDGLTTTEVLITAWCFHTMPQQDVHFQLSDLDPMQIAHKYI